MQDPKFIFELGRLVKAEDGTTVPMDEPVMVFRGKDEVTPYAIAEYIRIMEAHPESALAREHAKSARERLNTILDWQETHPSRVGMGCHTCEGVKRERLTDLPSLQARA